MTIVSDYTALLTGLSWNGASTSQPAVVTYSFETSAQYYYAADPGVLSYYGSDVDALINSFESFSASDRNMTRQALDRWSDVSGLQFVEVEPGEGEIRFANYDINVGVPLIEQADGYAYLPFREIVENSFGVFSANEDKLGGDVFIDKFTTLTPYLITHEIGHALGLNHPFDTDFGNITLTPSLDDISNTVMSYFGTPTGNLGYLDVDAIQHMHGNDGNNSPLLSWSWDSASGKLEQTWNNASHDIFGTGQRDVINGGGGNDKIAGMANDDVLNGGNGDDILIGGPGEDFLMGGRGADKYFGGDGADAIDFRAEGAMTGASGISYGIQNTDPFGNFETYSGIEIVFGTDHADQIFEGFDLQAIHAGGGDDLIIRDGFDALIDGGEGIDTVSNQFNFGTVNLQVSVMDGRIIGNQRMVDIENYIGSDNPENIIGSSVDNILTSFDGADTIYGMGGNDTLDGGFGDDHLDGGDGVNTASFSSFGPGVTVMLEGIPGSDPDPLNLFNATGRGNDRLLNIQNVTGSMNDDVIIGDGNRNTLHGGDGDDTLNGKGGRDILIGDAGADILQGGSNIDHALYNYSDAAVVVDLATGTGVGGHAEGDTLSDIERVTGSNGFGDKLFGDAQDNMLRGNGGDDTLRGEAGADKIVGGSGSDWSVYVTSDAAVTVDLAAGTGTGGHAEGDTLSGIEKLSGSSGFGDVLYGDAADNTLRGNGGDDVLRGDLGADILLGGSGVDHAVYNNSDAAVEVDLAAGTGVGGHAEGDTLTSIEKLTGSNGFGDKLFGNAEDNTLRGNGGDDTLRGNAGADDLQGGAGSDWAVYINSDGAVEVDLAAGTGFGGHAQGDALSGIEKLSGSSRFGDKLFGDAGDNVLRGNGGGDTLRGEAGADIIIGGSGSDWSVYVTSDDAVTVDLAAGTGMGGHAEGDTLSGIEKLSGSSGFGDSLYGDAADNTLRGNGGDDTLNGRQGNDTLVGGSGNDTFIFDANWGNDMVIGFNVSANEVLDFSSLGITQADLNINYGDSDTTITYAGNQIDLIGSTTLLLSDDFAF